MEQREYLEEIFWEGERTKLKATGDTAAQLMKQKFPKQPRLWASAQKISNWFSTFGQQVKKRTVTKKTQEEKNKLARTVASRIAAVESATEDLELRGPDYEQQDQEAFQTMEEVNREEALKIPNIPRQTRKRKAPRTCPN